MRCEDALTLHGGRPHKGWGMDGAPHPVTCLLPRQYAPAGCAAMRLGIAFRASAVRQPVSALLRQGILRLSVALRPPLRTAAGEGCAMRQTPRQFLCAGGLPIHM